MRSLGLRSTALLLGIMVSCTETANTRDLGQPIDRGQKEVGTTDLAPDWPTIGDRSVAEHAAYQDSQMQDHLIPDQGVGQDSWSPDMPLAQDLFLSDAPTSLDPLLSLAADSGDPCQTPGNLAECPALQTCRFFSPQEGRCEGCSPCGNLNASCSASNQCDILFVCYNGKCTNICPLGTYYCGSIDDCLNIGHATYGVCKPW